MESSSPERTVSSVAVSVVPERHKSFYKAWKKKQSLHQKSCLLFLPPSFSSVTLDGIENIEDVSKKPANQIQ